MSSTITLPRPASITRGGWRDRAACRGAKNPDLWFPRPGAAGASDTRKAKAVCAGCPVTGPCLEFALSSGARGTWGGVHEDDRPHPEPASDGPVLCGNSRHLMTEANTYVNPGTGGKVCRACRSAGERRRRAEREQVAA